MLLHGVAAGRFCLQSTRDGPWRAYDANRPAFWHGRLDAGDDSMGLEEVLDPGPGPDDPRNLLLLRHGEQPRMAEIRAAPACGVVTPTLWTVVENGLHDAAAGVWMHDDFIDRHDEVLRDWRAQHPHGEVVPLPPWFHTVPNQRRSLWRRFVGTDLAATGFTCALHINTNHWALVYVRPDIARASLYDSMSAGWDGGAEAGATEQARQVGQAVMRLYFPGQPDVPEVQVEVCDGPQQGRNVNECGPITCYVNARLTQGLPVRSDMSIHTIRYPIRARLAASVVTGVADSLEDLT